MEIYGELDIEMGDYRLVFDITTGLYASMTLLRHKPIEAQDEGDDFDEGEDEKVLFEIRLECPPRPNICRFEIEREAPFAKLLARLAGGKVYGFKNHPEGKSITTFDFPNEESARHFAWVVFSKSLVKRNN